MFLLPIGNDNKGNDNGTDNGNDNTGSKNGNDNGKKKYFLLQPY